LGRPYRPRRDVAPRGDAEELVHARIRLALLAIQIEARTSALALQPGVREDAHRVALARDAERGRDRLAGVARDREADLVHQRERTDRPAERGHRAVDVLDPRALVEHPRRLGDLSAVHVSCLESVSVA